LAAKSIANPDLGGAVSPGDVRVLQPAPHRHGEIPELLRVDLHVRLRGSRTECLEIGANHAVELPVPIADDTDEEDGDIRKRGGPGVAPVEDDQDLRDDRTDACDHPPLCNTEGVESGGDEEQERRREPKPSGRRGDGDRKRLDIGEPKPLRDTEQMDGPVEYHHDAEDEYGPDGNVVFEHVSLLCETTIGSKNRWHVALGQGPAPRCRVGAFITRDEPRARTGERVACSRGRLRIVPVGSRVRARGRGVIRRWSNVFTHRVRFVPP
jgi:hypothetical protein